MAIHADEVVITEIKESGRKVYLNALDSTSLQALPVKVRSLIEGSDVEPKKGLFELAKDTYGSLKVGSVGVFSGVNKAKRPQLYLFQVKAIEEVKGEKELLILRQLPSGDTVEDEVTFWDLISEKVYIIQ